MNEPPTEEILYGGNTSVVVRVGDTVRRHTGHWTTAVHALLGHLEEVGFRDAPTVLGFDDRGREVLHFVEGEVGVLAPGEPLAPWFCSTEACVAIGEWLRRFHDAQRGFEPDPALPWRMVPGRRLAAGEVMVHHDVAPYNTIRRADGGLTVIDWDFCSPGDPVEDLAFTAWQWIPLWADRTSVAAQQGGAPTVADATAKLASLLDGYGASPEQRSRLLGACVAQMSKHADDVEALAATDPAFARLVEMGVSRNARLDGAFVLEHQGALRGAPVWSQHQPLQP